MFLHSPNEIHLSRLFTFLENSHYSVYASIIISGTSSSHDKSILLLAYSP